MRRSSTSCYDKALELLSRRSHFRRELEAKLARRGFSSEDVREAMDRLAEQGYLDDLATARELVRSRLDREALGSRRLLAELRRRGAGEPEASRAVGELAPEDELPTARRAAERWLQRSGRRDPKALARHLERRGFSSAVILAILRGDAGRALE